MVNTKSKVIWAGGVADSTCPVQDPEVECFVEGLWTEVAGHSWMVGQGNYACMNYAMRAGLAGLPTDDDVYYVKIKSLGFLVHSSELERGQ